MEQKSIDAVALTIKQEDSDDVKKEPDSEITVEVEPCLELEQVDDKKNEEQSSSTSLTIVKIKRQSRQKTRRKIMGGQARELIAKIYQHMKTEALKGVKNLSDARWRTAQATGVSEKTVSRILKEKRRADERGSPMRSPHRNKKPRKCLRRDMEQNEEIIRETIENYEREVNRPLTLHGIRSELREKIGYNGCIETLRRVLNNIGYVFQAKKNNSVLMKE